MPALDSKMMDCPRETTIRLHSALVGATWKRNVVLRVNSYGVIQEIRCDANSQVDLEVPDMVGLPGMPNVHSHAFQRGFAGLSEFRTAGRDSFWTWRELMYRFVEQLSAEDVFVIARQTYLDMLLAGYTFVGEFHYLHRLADASIGPKSMSDSIFRAARETGIGLCHLPVLYQRGGFDGRSLSKSQQQFELSVDEYVDLFQHCQELLDDQRPERVGLAIHSLRAVEPAQASEVINAVEALRPGLPIHVHVAEQEREVESCLNIHGLRPVEFLFNQFDVDSRWCLIHATHLNDEEISKIAKSGAVVGLCPTTEANLGDGIFRACDFLDAGGRVSIGSDSHCSIDVREELRLLEYGQRLQTHQRALLGSEAVSVGERLYRDAARYGGMVLGGGIGEISVGSRADIVLVDSNCAAIAGASESRLLDRFVFCNAGNPVVGAFLGGRLISFGTPDFQELLFQSRCEFRSVCERLANSDE